MYIPKKEKKHVIILTYLVYKKGCVPGNNNLSNHCYPRLLMAFMVISFWYCALLASWSSIFFQIWNHDGYLSFVKFVMPFMIKTMFLVFCLFFLCFFGTFIEVCHILAFLTSSMIFCIYACDTFRVLWLAYLLWDRAKGRKELAEWICLYILEEIRRLRTS